MQPPSRVFALKSNKTQKKPCLWMGFLEALRQQADGLKP